MGWVGLPGFGGKIVGLGFDIVSLWWVGWAGSVFGDLGLTCFVRLLWVGII